IADGGERCAVSLRPAAALLQTARILAAAPREPAGLRVLLTARAKFSKGRLRTGTLHYPTGALADIMAAALQRGFRLAVHALGNEGVRAALDGYEQARRRTGWPSKDAGSSTLTSPSPASSNRPRPSA